MGIKRWGYDAEVFMYILPSQLIPASTFLEK